MIAFENNCIWKQLHFFINSPTDKLKCRLILAELILSGLILAGLILAGLINCVPVKRRCKRTPLSYIFTDGDVIDRGMNCLIMKKSPNINYSEIWTEDNVSAKVIFKEVEELLHGFR